MWTLRVSQNAMISAVGTLGVFLGAGWRIFNMVVSAEVFVTVHVAVNEVVV